MTRNEKYNHLIKKAKQRIINIETLKYYEIFGTKTEQRKDIMRYVNLIANLEIRKANQLLTLNQLLDEIYSVPEKSDALKEHLERLKLIKFGNAKGGLFVPLNQTEIMREVWLCRLGKKVKIFY